MEKKELFSREALNKLRSPEKLDTMFAITTPVSWIGLAVMGLLLMSILLWSFFGAFTVKADGMGLQYVKVYAVDNKGRVVPNYDGKITFNIDGPARIIAVDNGNHSSDATLDSIKAISSADIPYFSYS